MTKVIKEVKPDIIHAHNIFSAKMVSEIDTFPLVYDNHEYWSIYLKRQLEAEENLNKNIRSFQKKYPSGNSLKNAIRYNLHKRYVKIWSDLEIELIKNIPTITVSNTIVTDLKKIGKKVFLVPNFPLFKEINWIPQPNYHQSLSSVYAGVEPKGPVKSLHRNLEGFVDIFENDSIGQLFVIGQNEPPTKKCTL